MLDAVFALSSARKVPVVFLSGDVHMSAVFAMTNAEYPKACVFQVTSSPITRPPAPSIADVVLADRGTLKSKRPETKKPAQDEPARPEYRFWRLAKFHARNFCILASEIDRKTDPEGALTLNVDFYGETGKPDEVLRKRIELIRAGKPVTVSP
jgi:hypothetical protein